MDDHRDYLYERRARLTPEAKELLEDIERMDESGGPPREGPSPLGVTVARVGALPRSERYELCSVLGLLACKAAPRADGLREQRPWSGRGE